MRKLLCTLAAFGLVSLVAPPAVAEDAKANAKEEKALKARAEEFIAAFAKGDAEALAAFWTPDGDYVDQAGTTLSGRKAIQGAFEKQFAAAKGAKLRIATKSLRFVKGDLAIEDGTTEILYPNDIPPTGARYTALHVKQDGKWYLASVRDAVYVPPSNHDKLRELEWLAGEWVNAAEKGEAAKATYSWAENDNFLVSSFVAAFKDVPVAGGTQWIGWDAAAKTIRSWSFNSNGSFAEGTWSRDGDKWSAKVTATLADGKKVTATVVLTKVDADHFTWQSTKRSLDGKEIPDTEVVKMKRAK
ncbi:MAG TPA: SgcJ/EcaC family oxidoreductase [Gemmataceae bacterium]|nr:SgcJ/EcaC family oxidoreductase [Gemmataceae bacterium]